LVTTNLPALAAMLNFAGYINNGTTALAAALHCSHVTLKTWA
jgi:hypothetical protein